MSERVSSTNGRFSSARVIWKIASAAPAGPHQRQRRSRCSRARSASTMNWRRPDESRKLERAQVDRPGTARSRSSDLPATASSQARNRRDVELAAQRQAHARSRCARCECRPAEASTIAIVYALTARLGCSRVGSLSCLAAGLAHRSSNAVSSAWAPDLECARARRSASFADLAAARSRAARRAASPAAARSRSARRSAPTVSVTPSVIATSVSPGASAHARLRASCDVREGPEQRARAAPTSPTPSSPTQPAAAGGRRGDRPAARRETRRQSAVHTDSEGLRLQRRVDPFEQIAAGRGSNSAAVHAVCRTSEVTRGGRDALAGDVADHHQPARRRPPRSRRSRRRPRSPGRRGGRARRSPSPAARAEPPAAGCSGASARSRRARRRGARSRPPAPRGRRSARRTRRRPRRRRGPIRR